MKESRLIYETPTPRPAPEATPVAEKGPELTLKEVGPRVENSKKLLKEKKYAEAKTAIANVKERTAAAIKIARAANKPQELADWEKAQTDVERQESEIDREEKLANNPVDQNLRAIGGSTAIEWTMNKLSSAGSGIANTAEVVYERGLKPLWERVIKPLYENISKLFHGMGPGMKKGLASMLEMIGMKEWADRLRGTGGDTPQEKETRQTLKDIEGALTLSGTNVSLSRVENDEKFTEKIRNLHKILTGRYTYLPYKELVAYIAAAIKEKHGGVLPDGAYTIEQIATWAGEFNDKKKTDGKAQRESENEEERKKATPAPAPAPAPATPPAAK
jgi:hypothetical protein